MKYLALIGGMLGLLVSLAAQLFAVIDDSYTFGNIGFLGMLSGITAAISSFYVTKKPMISGTLLILTSITGIYALAFLSLIPSTMILLAGMYTLDRSNQIH
ncbi:hypothetical protein [Terribacillus sp. DMT04]|uniref:hypothetical protein n=1 Tax=Terribacillus sp. DMT04 TaxID=2850441 RepID=UPI001C2BAA6C|nr:hypothetical protein [Terribacillus sp. DMT04]QXE03241.1 hypothetical protein KS242_08770 [Terribacillus sp. DMT04]